MDRADISFWLSIAGFATSSILAIIKGIEFYSARRVTFAADTRLTGSEQYGNTIVLLNKSNIPATISYLELVWVDRSRTIFGWRLPWAWEVVARDSPIDGADGYDETVPPHATHSLWFRDENHFDWRVSLKEDIYLKLWLAGRGKPIWLWITGPSHQPK